MYKGFPSAVIVILGILTLLCFCCLLTCGSSLFGLYLIGLNIPPDPNETPSFYYPTDTPTPPIVVTRPPIEAVSTDTLSILRNTSVPENDLYDLACRLEGKCSVPRTLATPAAPRRAGERQNFWVTNVETNENFQVTATLRYVTEHVYFWIEDGVAYREKDLEALAEAFENKIYPTDRAFFGSEWAPGVDGDAHIYILYARGLGWSLAGYFSSADEYHPLVHEYSNAHEMFLLNADTVGLGEEFTYGVLAHEFQHMIHRNLDRNESSWLNEGFSEAAAFLNGYDVGGFDWMYAYDPDLQLNDWPNDKDATSPHYGAGFLFVTYFLDRFGEQATRALAANPLNGMESVDDTLNRFGVSDTLTGQPISADDVFVEWAIANYLLDKSVGDGRYYYHNYPDAPQTADTDSIYDCPFEGDYRVHQYGVDYINIACEGDYALTFNGSTQTRLLPADPHSGSYAFWSNKGDESDMTLTREFDFTGLAGPITLTYWTWYDLEVDYDYLYLEASPDGQRWQILITPSGTAEDPSGNSFGWGYNGVSGGWIQEAVDLTRFAGQKVFLRFEYVTDAAVNGEGLLLDDVSIPEIGYFTDFESGDDGWEAVGFVRVENALPQTFRLALILKGRDTTVQMITVSADQTVEIPFSLGDDVDSATLVVSGTTRFTREPASYTIGIR